MSTPRTPLGLYLYLLRKVRQLPPDVQEHYRHHIRQQFNSHADEDDAGRIQQIIHKAVDDMNWLLKKVRIEFTKNLF
ncbi:LYR motif containing protein 9 [Fasciola gigantica]|uniref:LYR motif-containing protein 9 n=1 Tax=Fasciola gigantica TaxID=46835 RepID=A0A504Y8U9_FASGI|nr:LYR motif containing protein 9 [Fasciola gigantica]